MAIKELYQILEQMVEAAEAGDKNRVFQLNRQFETLFQENRDKLPEYDNCRQSCIMSFSLPNVEDLVSDARERLKRIYKSKV